MTEQPPLCPGRQCEERIEWADDMNDDGLRSWRCSCGRFGIILPDDYAKAHPEEERVYVVGVSPRRKAVTRERPGG